MLEATQTETGTDGSITVTEWTITEPLMIGNSTSTPLNIDNAGFFIFFSFIIFVSGFLIASKIFSRK